MKNLLITVAACLPFITTAQSGQGSIIYEVSTKVRFGPPGSAPHGFTQAFELLYTEKQSHYSYLPEAMDNHQNPEGTLVRSLNSSVLYFDFVAGRKVEQRELQDAVYLIQEPIEKLPWTITAEEKILLDQKVVKAFAFRQDSSLRTTMENGVLKKEVLVDTSRIEAWFAPGIPVPAGPAEFQGQLPGLVLELRFDNDRRVYLAKEIRPKVKRARLKEPLKGKPISRVEFQKALEEEVAAFQKFLPAQQIRVDRSQ